MQKKKSKNAEKLLSGWNSQHSKASGGETLAQGGIKSQFKKKKKKEELEGNN